MTTEAIHDRPIAGQEDAGRPASVSIVIPTYNEADNVAELLSQLGRAIPATTSCEVIFVDDSTDDTPDVIAAAARHCPIPVTVLHRDEAVGGLGGAVVEGLRAASAPWIVVMDGDLQHPPSVAPELIIAGEHAAAELVVASRYAQGGSRGGLSSGYRLLVSGASTLLAKVAFARRLQGISDPMSGFFAVRRTALDLDQLQPFGYKILLELVVRCRFTRVAEVAYHFRERFAGDSKSTLREGFRFLRHLMTLRFGDARARMLVFGVIGLSGFLPNLATQWLLTRQFGMYYAAAAVVANQVAIVWNFLLIDHVLFRHRRRRHWSARLGKFMLFSNVDLAIRIPLLAVLVEYAGLNDILSTAATLVLAFMARFAVTDRMIYLPRPEKTTPKPVPADIT